jgi:hypothetical protein
MLEAADGMIASYGRRQMDVASLGPTTGLCAFVPETIQEGDIIVILCGGPVPYVLRPKSSGLYTLVDECYFHGIMQGEMLKYMDSKEEVFNIE